MSYDWTSSSKGGKKKANKKRSSKPCHTCGHEADRSDGQGNLLCRDCENDRASSSEFDSESARGRINAAHREEFNTSSVVETFISGARWQHARDAEEIKNLKYELKIKKRLAEDYKEECSDALDKMEILTEGIARERRYIEEIENSHHRVERMDQLTEENQRLHGEIERLSLESLAKRDVKHILKQKKRIEKLTAALKFYANREEEYGGNIASQALAADDEEGK